MPIFNETFTDEKPIYYPSNWESGKTAQELFEEWKLTTQFFLISNILQCLIAGLWLCLVFVIFNAIKQMWRLYNLPDDKRQKIQNRQYINKNFIMSACFMAIMALSITISLCIMNQFTRYALLKGFCFCISAYGATKLYIEGKTIYVESRRRKRDYQKLKKEEHVE